MPDSRSTHEQEYQVSECIQPSSCGAPGPRQAWCDSSSRSSSLLCAQCSDTMDLQMESMPWTDAKFTTIIGRSNAETVAALQRLTRIRPCALFLLLPHLLSPQRAHHAPASHPCASILPEPGSHLLVAARREPLGGNGGEGEGITGHGGEEEDGESPGRREMTGFSNAHTVHVERSSWLNEPFMAVDREGHSIMREGVGFRLRG